MSSRVLPRHAERGGRQTASTPLRLATARLRPPTSVALLTLAVWILLSTNASAAPSKFVLEYCDPELPQTSDPWLVYSVDPPEGVPVRWFNDCLKPGGSIGIQEVGSSGTAAATLSVSVPATPGGYVESESILGGTAALGNANTDVYIREPNWPFPNGGESLKVFRIRNAMPDSGDGDGDFQIGWNCVGPLNSCGPGPIVYARDIAVTEVDPNPPKVSAVGSLLSGQVARGQERIEASASDLGGGVAEIEVLVGGILAGTPVSPPCDLATATAESYEGTIAVDPSPCPAQAKGTWDLDTSAPPFHEGTNEVKVCTVDFSVLTAGQRSCTMPTSVLVDNSCTESSTAGGEVLSAVFAADRKSTVLVPYGHPAMVRGELATSAGAPVGSATICVQSQTEGSGHSLQDLGTITTDSSGHFNYEVPPGPDRRFIFGYRHDSFQLTRELTLSSGVSPTFETSRTKLQNGQWVRFDGGLPGPDQQGRVVVLQANVKGSRRWVTFRKATTGARGGFKADYHFTRTTRPTTYRFRAVVPRQAGYPWAGGHSKPTLVRVKP